MALDGFNAWIETYISLVAYFILHMIFVISSDFVEAFNIPPLNIGIYVDKLAAIRALLMVIADLLEWGITQKGYGDSQHDWMSARVVGALLWFIAMLACRLAYLILVYKSDNKSLTVFITLCVEGFWFGMFQMGFFAIGPEYNALTSLGIHTMGNFIFFFQLILQHYAKSKPKINPLYRVRVHAWICFITTVIAFPKWFYFLFFSRMLDFARVIKEKGEEAKAADPAELNNVASKAGELYTALGGHGKIFGLDAALGVVKTNADSLQTAISGVNTSSIKNNQAKAKGALSAIKQYAEWFVQALKLIKPLIGGNDVQEAITNLEQVKEKANAKANLISGGGDSGVGKEHVLSPLLLFIVGAFAEDFAVPGVLPFALLDPERASLVNYMTPVFFMSGASVVVFVNNVFSKDGFVSDHDSRFKEWSEGKAHGWHCVWLLNVPKYIAFFLAMWSIHGTYSSLRCIIQSRWRVMLLTMFVVVPRATLEVMGYVGVANWSIAAFQGGDFEAFNLIAVHDVLAMFCRFVYGKFAVGYNWTSISPIYVYYLSFLIII